MCRTPLDFYLRFVVNEKPLNLEKTISSVLSVLLLSYAYHEVCCLLTDSISFRLAFQYLDWWLMDKEFILMIFRSRSICLNLVFYSRPASLSTSCILLGRPSVTHPGIPLRGLIDWLYNLIYFDWRDDWWIRWLIDYGWLVGWLID